MAAAHVFVADLEAPALDEDDRHHLSRSLRIRSGEEVTASDGAGSWRCCRYATGGGLEPLGPLVYEEPPAPSVAVGFVVMKGSRPEWVIQKLTEVGIDRILPLSSSRSVVKWEPPRAERNMARLRRVAREAAMQCRRNRLPDIAQVVPVSEMVSGGGGHAGLALAERGGGPVSLDRPCVLVGPEGGWDRTELVPGLPLVGLGPNVLRAETAAVAAGVLLCGLRSRLVNPASVAAGIPGRER